LKIPCSLLQGIFKVQGSEEARFPCCSFTPQQAAGYALAMHFPSRAPVCGTAARI